MVVVPVALATRCGCAAVAAARTYSWNKSARLNLDTEAHSSKHGNKWSSHQAGIAAKTGNNVFFVGAKIPTRNECDDSNSKKVTLAGLLDSE